MNVLLKPELEEFIQEQVTAGGYASASEVVEQALLLMQEQSQFVPEDLDQELQVGVDALDAGDYEEYDESSMADLAASIAARGRAQLAAERDQDT